MIRPHMVGWRKAALALGCAGLAMSLGGHARADTPGATVVHVTVVNGIAASDLDQALADHPAVVVLDIDSAGGSQSALRQMVTSISASTVPVFAEIGPGASAQDAAWVLAMSADVIGVAGDAVAGAPHPMNNAGQWAGTLALAHHRNAGWVAASLNQGLELYGTSLLRQGVAEFQSDSVPQLITEADNYMVRGHTFHASGVTVTSELPSGWNAIVSALASPDAAYLLLVIAVALVGLWLAHPGMVLTLLAAGLAGAATALAFVNLPINLLGAVLMVAAMVVFVFDIAASTHGALTAVGAVLMVCGGWQLIDTSAMAHGVNPILIALTVGALTAAYAFVIPRLLAARRLPYSDPATQLIGELATVAEDLDPDGLVNLRGTLWRASASAGQARIGEQVEVVDVTGLRLTVRKS